MIASFSTVAVLLFGAAVGQPDSPPIIKTTLEDAAKDLAGDIRKLVQTSQGANNSIRLGSFEGPPGNGSGAKLSKLLEASFAEGEIKVVSAGGFRVGGNIEISNVDDKLVMVIEAEVFNATGRRVHTLVRRIVMDRDSALAASGATVDLSVASAASTTTVAPGSTPAVGTTPPAVGSPPPAVAIPPAVGANPPAVVTPPAVGATPPVVGATPPVVGATPPVVGATPPVGTAPPAVGPPNVAGNPAGVQAAGRPQTEIALPKAAATQQVLTAIVNPTVELKKVPVQVKSPIGVVQTVVQNIVKASGTSPYGIEIVRATNRAAFAPAEITLEEAPGGQVSFVQLSGQDIFGIKIHNESQRPVGCALSIDGINVFAFSEIPAWRDLGKMVISPAGGFVGGWHKNDAVSYEFITTKYADSAAAKLGVEKGVGTITAVFFETFDPNNPAENTRGTPPAEAIGLGREVAVAYKPVSVRFGDPVAVVTIRYNRPDLPIGDAALPPR